ncbi:calponin domain-containing protein [Fadolivirus algeromassiliense]|jgi:hypothetical protein|uniref:Calponin domain-containing protein n=1 Tax=Fadolivirus FV1/VV64 TaxID=3070911 RepID=A0A7D3UU81_9VIRU|nr:calponin domain-containing protein [Fadolivirus algeromassiliense]QKF93971.1 calponin domain-containing protein [Fadolivirus FV1/VV64]
MSNIETILNNVNLLLKRRQYIDKIIENQKINVTPISTTIPPTTVNQNKVPTVVPLISPAPQYKPPKFPPPILDKKSLIKWVNSKINKKPYFIEIKNFTKAWQDGHAFCALVTELTSTKTCESITNDDDRILASMKTFINNGVYVYADHDDNDYFIGLPLDDKSMIMQLSAIYDRFKNHKGGNNKKKYKLRT